MNKSALNMCVLVTCLLSTLVLLSMLFIPQVSVALFTFNLHIRVGNDNLGGITKPEPGDYPYYSGGVVEVEAIPNANYMFNGWTGPIDEEDKMSNPCHVTMDDEKTIKAWFCYHGNQSCVYVPPIDISIPIGDTFKTLIRIETINNVFSWEAGFRFDPHILECVNFAGGPYLSDVGTTTWTPGTIDNVNGIVTSYRCTLEAGKSQSGAGVLAYVTFRAKNYGTTAINLTDEDGDPCECTVLNPYGMEISVAFVDSEVTVREPGVGGELPTITSIAPDHGKQDETLVVTVTGTNFTGATAVSFGAGITVNSFNVDFSTQITANISIDADAATGARDVSVTTLGGTDILADGFTVEKGGICFIATAAYGTPMAPQIQVLRDFRDEYLLTSPLGKGLVDFYYRVSPPIAEFITEHPSLKPIVRVGLVPAVAMSIVAVKTTLAQKIAIVGSMALVSALAVIWYRRRAGKARSAN
jgi:hypothetical protein